MMLILNRFDVIQREVREVLARGLSEYREDAEQIRLQRLASKPALLQKRGEFKGLIASSAISSTRMY